MADAEGAALRRQRVQHMGEHAELLPGIGLAVFAVHVGDGKVGENALGVQSRQGAGGRNGVHAALKMLTAHQKAQPGHPGVHLDVHPQGAAAFHRLGAVFLRLGLGGHRLGDVVGNQLGHHLRRRMPQNQDGHGNAAVTQFPGLVQTGHRQIVRPQLLQFPGNLHRAVAVGIRLHHPQIFHTGASSLPGDVIIVFQRIQVNFRPGAPQNRILQSDSPVFCEFAGLPLFFMGFPLLYHRMQNP